MNSELHAINALWIGTGITSFLVSVVMSYLDFTDLRDSSAVKDRLPPGAIVMGKGNFYRDLSWLLVSLAFVTVSIFMAIKYPPNIVNGRIATRALIQAVFFVCIAVVIQGNSIAEWLRRRSVMSARRTASSTETGTVLPS